MMLQAELEKFDQFLDTNSPGEHGASTNHQVKAAFYPRSPLSSAAMPM
jgi:hypothetical protein